MAHPTRMFQLAQSLSENHFEVHFATIKAAFDFLDLKSSKAVLHEIQSVSNLIFNQRLYKTELPITLDELNSFCSQDLLLIETVKPDVVITDFRLSFKGAWKKTSIPWLNLIQYHWHPDYKRPKLVPAIFQNKIFGRRLVEFFNPLISPLIMAKQLSIVNQFEKQHGAPVSPSLFDFYCSGDHLLFPDLAELFQQSLENQNGSFIGPIIWTSSKFKHVFLQSTWPGTENMKTAYVSLGSTGSQNLNPAIVDVLTQLKFRIYLSNSGKNSSHRYPPSVRSAPFLPADVMLRQSDLHVCNGGTGTTYHSLSHGVPVLAVTSNLDQCLHMDVLQKNGLGESVVSDSFSDLVFKLKVQQLNKTEKLMSKINIAQNQIGTYNAGSILEKIILKLI